MLYHVCISPNPDIGSKFITYASVPIQTLGPSSSHMSQSQSGYWVQSQSGYNILGMHIILSFSLPHCSLAKEKAMYEKEVVDQEAKIKTMKAEGKDEYDIKKQVEVLEESKNMVPDCQRRLAGAHGELVAFLVSLG